MVSSSFKWAEICSIKKCTNSEATQSVIVPVKQHKMVNRSSVPGSKGEFALLSVNLSTAYHHGFSCSEVWQQHVFLHDVTRHFPECPQVPGFPIHKNLTLHPCFPFVKQKHKHFCRVHQTRQA